MNIFYFDFNGTFEKVKVGNDQEMARSERNFHSKNPGGKKNLINNQVLILRKHIVRRMSSFFPIGGHSTIQTYSPAENKFDLELSSKVFSLLNYVQ